MYPKTMTGTDGQEIVVHEFRKSVCDKNLCYVVVLEGPPESYLGDPRHFATVGVEYPTVLRTIESEGLTTIYYLPDTTDFPKYASECDRLEGWSR